MNKISFILISLVLIIASFFIGYSIDKPNSLINEEEECKSQGGIWHKYLLPSDELLDNPFCQLPFSDAGKECTDSSQCIGNCEPPQEFFKRENGNWEVSYRENVSGTCSKFSKGCESYQIVNGTLDLESQAICVV